MDGNQGVVRKATKGSPVPLARDARAGATMLEIASSPGFAGGDYLLISARSETERYGEIVRVKATTWVAPFLVELHAPLVEDYGAKDEALVQRIDMVAAPVSFDNTEAEALRRIVEEWIGEGFTVPPYSDAQRMIFEKLGVRW